MASKFMKVRVRVVIDRDYSSSVGIPFKLVGSCVRIKMYVRVSRLFHEFPDCLRWWFMVLVEFPVRESYMVRGSGSRSFCLSVEASVREFSSRFVRFVRVKMVNRVSQLFRVWFVVGVQCFVS